MGDGSDETLRADDFEWRRLRIGFEGEWRKLVFEFDVDPAFDEGDELKDARLGLRFSRELQIDGGHIKLPVSPEWLTSAAKTDFIERAAVVESIAPGRDWGGMLSGELGRALEYSAGVFEGDARTSTRRAGTTAAGRLVLKPSGWLDLGGSFSQGDVVADPAEPGHGSEPEGPRGHERDGLRVLPGRLRERTASALGRGRAPPGRPRVAVGRVPRGARRAQGPGTDARGPAGRLRPGLVGDGHLARHRRAQDPHHPARAAASSRGPGAVELSARYEELWFDDVSNEGFESAGSRAGEHPPRGHPHASPAA